MEKNIEIINSKFSNTVTNEKKKKIWENITIQINALGIANRTAKEIKTKWINMHQTAKKKNTAKISYIADRQEGGRVQSLYHQFRRKLLIFSKVRRHLTAYRDLRPNLVRINITVYWTSDNMIHKKNMFLNHIMLILGLQTKWKKFAIFQYIMLR